MKTREIKSTARQAKENSPFFGEGSGFFQPGQRRQAFLGGSIQKKPIFESEAEYTGKGIQRKCAACEKEDKRIQKKGNNISAPDSSSPIEATLNSSKGGGSPLEGHSRERMEQHFGADFGGVRIHNDSQAAGMSKQLNAQAFTHGSDIYFDSGKYNTRSKDGQKLLAHELTHVVQQGSAGVSPGIQRLPGSPAGGCGVCYGSPRLAGRVAHAFIQEAFQARYPFMLSEHYILSILPAAANFEAGFLDLAVLESSDQIAIGEIKPANAKGLLDGEAKLSIYETALSALGMKVRRMDYTPPLAAIPFPTLGRGPACAPLQGLFVDPAINGLYTYWCMPDYAELRPECTCLPLEELEEEAEKEAEKAEAGEEQAQAAEEATEAEELEAGELESTVADGVAEGVAEGTEVTELTGGVLGTSGVAEGGITAGEVAEGGLTVGEVAEGGLSIGEVLEGLAAVLVL